MILSGSLCTAARLDEAMAVQTQGCAPDRHLAGSRGLDVAMRMLSRQSAARALGRVNALSRGCGLDGLGTGLSGGQESIHNAFWGHWSWEVGFGPVMSSPRPLDRIKSSL